jgi:hypothetical protein
MGECCFPEITIGKHMGSTWAGVRLHASRQWRSFEKASSRGAPPRLAKDGGAQCGLLAHIGIIRPIMPPGGQPALRRGQATSSWSMNRDA